MFRSPNDISSSETDSSSDDDDAAQASGDNEEIEIDGVVGEPLESLESATESVQEHNHGAVSHSDQQSNVAVSTDVHTRITASLLEYFYHTRAVELLNEAQPDANYTRESPQAKALGRNMFVKNSAWLADHDLIPKSLHEDGLREDRQQILFGLQNLPMQALSEDGALPSSSGASRNHRGIEYNFRETSKPRNLSPHGISRHSARKSPHVDFSPVHNVFTRPVASGFDIFDPNLALIDSSTLQSPRADMGLSSRQSPTFGFRSYKTEFAEIKILGRGGFGTVFHAFNYLDNQHYAIKKIPINTKRVKRWQEGNWQEMESVWKEIRTLASVEHRNVVRYYTAWIERGEIPASDNTTTPNTIRLERPLVNRKLLPDRSGKAIKGHGDPGSNPRRSLPPEDDGIVFGEESASQTHANPAQALSRLVRQEDTSTSTVSFTDSNIFTDGDGGAHSLVSTSGQSAWNLHIQMSLHPLNLSNYLSPSPKSQSPPKTSPPRHCFHLLPSTRLLLGILSGVEYLHAQRIIHRDLKPGNIFLSESSSSTIGFVNVGCESCPNSKNTPRLQYLNPRIGDFGLVACINEVRAEGAILKSINSPSLPAPTSVPTKVVGTELYRPPQPPSSSTPTPATAEGPIAVDYSDNNNRHNKVDEKIDVFALGIIFFELLWCFETKMERHILLHDLSKHAKLPIDFVAKLQAKENARHKNSERGPHIPDVAADMIATCICAMVDGNASKRWGCARVREYLERVLALCSSRTYDA